jgi:hypothetical protein
MTFVLGKSIKVGQKIKTLNGWRKVIAITDIGALTKDGVTAFGDTVYGWKSK